MLHLAKILLIKKFINRYFKNSIINLYIISIVQIEQE